MDDIYGFWFIHGHVIACLKYVLMTFFGVLQVLDFDFEKFCSVSLSNLNVYACLVCGK